MIKIDKVVLDIRAGTEFEKATAQAWDYHRKNDVTVEFEFNGSVITIEKKDVF